MNKYFEETIKESIAIIKSGTSAIHICSDDYSRIDEFVKSLALELDFTISEERRIRGETETETIKKPVIHEWNYGYGQVDFFSRAKIGSAPNNEKIPFQNFLENYKDKDNASDKIILIRNSRHIMEGELNRENLAQLQQTIIHLKKHLKGRAVIIYCDEKRFIPDELSSLVYFLEVKPPSKDELISIAQEFIENKNNHIKDETQKINLSDGTLDKLSSKCIGMSKDSFIQILEKAAMERENFENDVIPIAEKTKKQFVDKSGLLKFVNTAIDTDDVGGLDHLKWWLDQKKKAFENPEDAEKNGIKPAKGILLVGMPGCGKSLTAKAVANFFKLPLLSLDLGTIMGKYLGESEENLRRALRLAENSSPCVLWVDEIEKAFAGVGGDESGVSQRLFGYLLTWLNDKKERVFVMATANDVAVLPPEFLRRGRFDEIFYVDFPNKYERKEIFKIHLAKAFKGGRKKIEEILDIDDNKKKFDDLTRDKKKVKIKITKEDGTEEEKEIPDEKDKCTDGYAGSDIEALVNAAIERAWNQKKDKEKDLFDVLLKEQEYMTPLKEVLAEKIARNREKFGQYKLTSAAYSKENMQSFETDSEDDNENKRIEVAKDERCPLKIMDKLSDDKSSKVKLALLDNPNCHATVIVKLMDDSDPEVKAKANEKQSQTPNGIIEMAKKGNEQKLAVLKLPEIPEEALIEIANNGSKEVIEELLNRSSISEPVWKALISHARMDIDIKAFLKEHTNVPEDKNRQLNNENCFTCHYRTELTEYDRGPRCFLDKNNYKKIENFYSPICNGNNWKLRKKSKNSCMLCAYNNGKYCIRRRENNFVDDCILFKDINSEITNNCNNCKYNNKDFCDLHEINAKHKCRSYISKNSVGDCQDCLCFNGYDRMCGRKKIPDRLTKNCPERKIFN